jgi:hypothetical protein
VVSVSISRSITSRKIGRTHPLSDRSSPTTWVERGWAKTLRGLSLAGLL